MTNKNNKKNSNLTRASNRRQQSQRMAPAPRQRAPRAPKKEQSFLGQLGALAGNGISKIFGLGDYTLTQNSIYNQMSQDQVPVMHSDSESVTFRHREYIGDISTGTTFASTIYSINPGLSATFPFLSTIASCFQEYAFKGLVFEYKSTTSDAIATSTNLALGTVILAAAYRADQTAFTSKSQMENEMWSVSDKPSRNMLLPIECAPIENPMGLQYVRTNPTSGDVKLYDLCTLTVASVGSQAAYVSGELWASYEIVLRKPRVSDIVSLGLVSAGHLAASSLTGAVAAATPLGSASTTLTTVFNGLGILWVNGTQFSIPAGIGGIFMVSYSAKGDSTASVISPTITSTDSQAVLQAEAPYNVSGHLAAPVAAATSTVCISQVLVNVTAGPRATLININSDGTLPANVTAADLQVWRLPPTFA